MFFLVDMPILPAKWAISSSSVVKDELVARSLVASTFVLFLFVCAGAACVAAFVIWSELKNSFRWAGLLLAFGAGLVAFRFGFQSDISLVNYLGQDVFQKTVGQFPVADAGVATLKRAIFIDNVVVTFTSALITVATASLSPRFMHELLNRAEVLSDSEILQAVLTLARKVRNLKYLLFAAATMVFVGLLHTKAWVEWPLAYFPVINVDPNSGPIYDPTKADYQAVATAIVNFQAILFVLILAAVFLPTAIWLRGAGLSLAAKKVGRSDSEAGNRWLLSEGVLLTAPESAVRFFAIISPFMAPGAVSLIQRFTDLKWT